MKKLIVLMTILASISAVAGSTSKRGSIYIKGITEADVVAQAETMAADMTSQRDVRWAAQSDNCNLRRKVRSKLVTLI